MVKCKDCKWFIEQTLSDDMGTVFIGVCTAIINDEWFITESDEESNADCDLYVENSNDNFTKSA